MKNSGIRKLAAWKIRRRGLRPTDRPAGGTAVLDWNPWASVRGPFPHLPPQLLFCWAILVVAVVGSFFVFAGRPPTMLPFLGVLIAVAWGISHAVVRRLFGRERLRIDERGLAYAWSDGLTRRRRSIPFAEILSLTPYRVTVPGGNGHLSHPEYGVAIETTGRTLCVGQCRSALGAEAVHEDLAQALGEWCPSWREAPPSPDREVLDTSGMRPEPPADNTLICRREWDRTEVIAGGPDPTRDYRLLAWLLVAMPLVLVPMILSRSPMTAGLILAVWIIGMLLAIPEERRWTMRPGEIIATARSWGLGRSRTIELEWLKRLELRRRGGRIPWESRFDLVLVDLDDADRAIFGPMTEGEARWMAGIVADVLKDALPRDGQDVYRWSVSVEEPTPGSKAMADAWLDDPGAEKPRPE